MTYTEKRLKELLRIYLEGRHSANDYEELIVLLKLELESPVVEEVMAEHLELSHYDVREENVDWDAILENILKSDQKANDLHAPVKRLYEPPVRKMNWWKISVAIAILGFVIWSLVFVIGRDKGGDLPVAVTQEVQDVKAPEVNRAMITLADGRRVYLDSIGIGSLAIQQGVDIIKNADGVIEYTLRQAEGDILVYNTLTNPRGSRVIDITLSDGSRVWLNAGSSVTYPVAFLGNERRVSIEGEAYFEISTQPLKGRKIPFLVTSGEIVTEVLGTHFNVNSYGDDGVIKVTLLEGSVRVSSRQSAVSSQSGVIIKPGQQAKAVSSELSVVSGVDLEEVMAWKNGMFSFNRTDVRMIMKQLERWYDVEVVYEGNVENIDFTGGIARKENVSQVLKMLETTGVVEFKIEGKKIVVRRKN